MYSCCCPVRLVANRTSAYSQGCTVPESLRVALHLLGKLQAVATTLLALIDDMESGTSSAELLVTAATIS